MLVRTPQRGCALRRVVSLGADGSEVEADARPKLPLVVSRGDILAICDIIDVNGRQLPIESRPYGNRGLLRAIVRSRFARSSRRLVYVFDFRTSSVPEVSSPVQFRELGGDEIEAYRPSLGAGAQSWQPTSSQGGCVIGTMGGRQVYHAWYIRGEPSAVRGLPTEWQPTGRVLFLHDGVTEPAYRGQGIHSAATRWLLARERNMDTAHALAVVHADNPAARRAVAGAGFRVVGQID